MNPGERCIVQEGTWHNAFGDKDFSISCGMRLVVKDSIYIGGMRFFSFEETPEGNWYESSGVRSIRSYN